MYIESPASNSKALLLLLNKFSDNMMFFLGMGKPEKEPMRGDGEQEPWVHRGGLHAELRVGSVYILSQKNIC